MEAYCFVHHRDGLKAKLNVHLYISAHIRYMVSMF